MGIDGVGAIASSKSSEHYSTSSLTRVSLWFRCSPGAITSSNALAAAFLVVAGVAASSTAFGQGLRHFDRDHDGRVDTRRELLEERKGFNDGLNKGRADALAHRRFNPDILQRRFVSNDYREGFRKGYSQAYYQFAKNRGHHYGRGY